MMGSASPDTTTAKPFIEHLHELRKRLVWCVLALALAGGLGFAMHERLLAIIQGPLNQSLYYTSPAGGFNFIFKLSATFGLIMALPVIFYQIVRFLKPVLNKTTKLHTSLYVIWSIILAYGGVVFAYFISLPAALRFLTNFGGPNIQALINANEYFNFALAYLGGFALLFQIPLLMLFINRVKPQKPSRLMRVQRFIILGSFIIAAVLTPTPDPFNQLIMALPIIALYQIGILLIWLANRGTQPLPQVQVQAVVRPPVSTQPATRPAAARKPLVMDILPAAFDKNK